MLAGTEGRREVKSKDASTTTLLEEVIREYDQRSLSVPYLGLSPDNLFHPVP